jgi:hypothetical protein
VSRLLAANGAPIDFTLPGTVDTFQRPDGPLTGWSQRMRGSRWVDAYETHPTQFDPLEIEDGKLIAPGTVRDTYTPTDPVFSENYPVDPETGEKYSPLFVSHRLAWFDIGRDDDFELELAWLITQAENAVVQVSPCFSIDLEADPEEVGVLFAWDISLGLLFGLPGLGATYFHSVPMTPDVASCFDPSYYVNLGGGAALAIPEAGRHDMRVRCAGGFMQAWFDGAERTDPIARPAWSEGRTNVGIHVIGIHCDPDEVYPDGLPWTGQPGVDPPPPATVTRFEVNDL